jgi:uncharacterized membrane protein YccC
MQFSARISNSAARGTQLGFAVLISFASAMASTGLLHPSSAVFGALWASISAIVVLQSDVSATGSAARLRVWGTVVGALVSGTYLLLLPFTMVGLAVCVGLAVFGATWLNHGDGGRLAAITVTVIMLQGEMNPGQNPLLTVGMRFFEACLGAVAAVLVSWAWMQGAKMLAKDPAQ